MTARRRYAIGIDLGGTKIAGGAVQPDGAIDHELTVPTGAGDGPAAVIDRIASVIRTIEDGIGHPPEGVGIALPGPVDSVNGTARHAVNLGWLDIPLRAELIARGIQMPIVMQNDVKAGAVGEALFGAAIGVDHFVFLAVGTGLGGAAVSGGQVIEGADGWAMEVGHVVIDPEGRACPCGQRGCAETYASGIGVLANMQARRPDVAAALSVPAIVEAARQGDETARAVFADAGRALGIVMAWCAMLYNPRRIVIGGGLGLVTYDLLTESALPALHQRAHPGAWANLEIVRAAAPSTTLGAAALVWRALNA
ncbi:MAG: ROK family protein [Candidatus Flexifilum sp.]